MTKINNIKSRYKQTPIGIIPEDWEVKRVKNTFNFFPTASFSRANEVEDGEMQHLHYGDIHTKFDFQLEITDENLPKINSEKAERFEKIQIGDIILADASEDYEGVGKSVEIMDVSNFPIIAGLHTFHLREKKPNLALGFKGYLFSGEKIKHQFYRIAVGTKVYSLSKVALQDVLLPLPPLPEQKAIAKVLSTWDKAIEQYEVLLQQYELRKKWLMQNLLTGKKRVEGFEGEWKEKRLEKITLKKSSKVQANLLVENSGVYPVYGASGLVSHADFYEEELSYIAIVKDGSGVGNMFYLEGKSSVLGTLDIIQTKSENLFFLFNLLHKINFDKYKVGGAIPHIYYRDYKKEKLLIPSIKEQTAIAEILQTADKEIELTKERIEKLREQKKGLMQVLLTGRKRMMID